MWAQKEWLKDERRIFGLSSDRKLHILHRRAGDGDVLCSSRVFGVLRCAVLFLLCGIEKALHQVSGGDGSSVYSHHGHQSVI